ncbi:hotdog family protein [Desulfosporosinus fructosivorans]
MSLKVGDVFDYQKTFTEQEILQFGELTGDRGNHHIERDSQGKFMAQGLLTASVGTKIGGDLNYIAREMVSEFIRPVFSGDTIACELTITKADKKEGFTEVAMKSVYRNQHGKAVLVGKSYGIIRD